MLPSRPAFRAALSCFARKSRACHPWHARSTARVSTGHSRLPRLTLGAGAVSDGHELRVIVHRASSYAVYRDKGRFRYTFGHRSNRQFMGNPMDGGAYFGTVFGADGDAGLAGPGRAGGVTWAGGVDCVGRGRFGPGRWVLSIASQLPLSLQHSNFPALVHFKKFPPMPSTQLSISTLCSSPLDMHFFRSRDTGAANPM